MQQLDTLCRAGNEEAHDVDIHEHHLAEIEPEPRVVHPDLGPELVQRLRVDATEASSSLAAVPLNTSRNVR